MEETEGGRVHPEDLGIGRLFEMIRDGIIVADTKTQRIVLWNPAATNIFGYSSSEALGGMRVEDLVPERFRTRHRSGMARYRGTGRGPYIDANRLLDLPAVAKTGREIRVELSLSPIELADDNDARYVLAIVRDVTERNRAEEFAAQLPRHLSGELVLEPGTLPGISSEPHVPLREAQTAELTTQQLKVLRLLALGIAVIVGAAFAALLAANHTQKIAVPSYVYPGSLWTQMEAAVPTVSTAIINPASGPGPNQNPDYVNQVQKSQAAGLSVLGYVHTSYGARSIEAVKTEINNHYEWYGVNGIFLDEASTDCSLASSYYNELYNHIKARGGSAVVVLNPGTQTNECYTDVSDVLLTFEGTYNTYSSRYSAPSWVSRYPPSRFWHLVYSTSNTRAMERAVSLSKQRGAGWVYVTPDNLPNPWDTLPSGSYWSKELSAVQKD